MSEDAQVSFPPIVKFDIDSLKTPFGHRPQNINEFFLIEFLLRSSKIRKLYSGENGKQKFQAILRQRGLQSQDPFSGSHHSLLVNSKKFAKKMDELGYLDVDLGILDLGKIFSLPPGYKTTCDGRILHGPAYGGEAECVTRLRMSNPLLNPGSLSLYLDMRHPPGVIVDKLLPILQARHNEAMQQAQDKEAARVRRQNDNEDDSHSPGFVIRDVRAWLVYLHCYDYKYFGNKTYGQIGELMYGKMRSRTDNAKKAVKRIEAAIDYVDNKYVPDEFIENPPFGFITRFKSRPVEPSSNQL